MSRRIRITAATFEAIAELNDTDTAEAVWGVLPINAHGNLWGDEIYFEIPVFLESSGDAREAVAAGELGYWPTGHAFCIFFGRTPASRNDEPRAASPVNVFGRVAGDATVFRGVSSGEAVFIERIV